MSTILHLSDLHVHQRLKHDNNHRLSEIVRWVTARYAGMSVNVVITGDLVDDGTEEQYQNLVRLLMPLKKAGFRILAAPGNHDCGPMGNAYYASSRVYFQQHVLGELMGITKASTASDVMGELFPMVQHVDGVTYIGLDSVAGMLFEGMHFARGAIGSVQLARLREILAIEHGKRPIVVYLHHHPFDRAFTLCLRDADELKAALGGRYNLLLFGHQHRSETWPKGDGPLTADRIEIAAGMSTAPDERHLCELREVCLSDGRFVVSRQDVRV